MADERIDVVVTDGVDANVEKKLEGIARAADRGESYIKRLKAALSSVNVTAVDRLAAAMAKADSAQAKLISAQARLTNAQNAGSVAAAKVALANQKLATEAARTEAAQARAAAATSTAAIAAQRLQAAQTATTGSSNAAANAQQTLATATTAAGTAATNSGNSFRNYINSLRGAASASTAASAGATTAGARMAQGLNTAGAANVSYARAVRQTNHANANIIAQLNDIGVSLAGGQNPLLVLIQQGSQLQYIASTMEGGMKQLLATILRMLAPFAALAAVLAVVGLAFKGIKDEAADQADLQNFVKTLGLTKDEIKQLKDVTVTWGDTFGATMDVIAERLGTTTGKIKKWFGDAFDTVVEFAKFSIAIIYAGFVGGFKAIVKTWDKLPAAIGAAAIGAVNVAIAGIEKLINISIKGINWLSDKINSTFGMDLGRIAEVGLGQLSNMFAKSGQEVGAVFASEIQSEFRNAMGFMDDISARAAQRARERIAKQAREIIADRNPKQGPKPKVDNTELKRAHALEMVNLELDKELARMKMLKDERAIQQRMDQIEQSLAQKKIKLDADERKEIEGKVRAIEAYKYVQSELDRIYEDVIGPQRTYAATLQAAKELLDQGAISAARYAQELTLAARKQQEAVDPLFQMKEAMGAAEVTAKLYGAALERQNYYESIRQQYLARGIVLSQQYVAGVNAEVDALMRRNDALLQQQYIQSQLGAIVNPLFEQNREIEAQAGVYAELERLRQADLIREGDYQRAKAALWLKYNEYKLQNTADFFGALADVTKKGHGVVGAISKAAAVAEATIQGYLAVQKALASSPPPWNYIAAAAVAMRTGANVAGILSTNVGSFQHGGQFMVEGKSGIDANNINMNVTRGERVTVETPAQQRANDSAAAPIVDARTKVVTLFDEASFIAALDTDEGERLVMNIVRRNSGSGSGGEFA